MGLFTLLICCVQRLLDYLKAKQSNSRLPFSEFSGYHCWLRNSPTFKEFQIKDFHAKIIKCIYAQLKAVFYIWKKYDYKQYL